MRLCAFITVRVGNSLADSVFFGSSKSPPVTPAGGLSVGSDSGMKGQNSVIDDLVSNDGPRDSVSTRDDCEDVTDEFSDWDESDDEEESVQESPAGGEERRGGTGGIGGAVRRSSFRHNSGNASTSCFDTILIHNNMQEIEALLAS